MINIEHKENCCGCGACEQRCPKHCIRMLEDEEGFLYPHVDTSLCIDCGLCEKVCPVINQNDSRQPLNVYAAINTNEEIRLQSSSGGIFTILAEKVIENGGVIFGAKWDKSSWIVVHDYTETLEGIAAFRSSKYLQSRIADTFVKVEYFLKQGRQVLFSGTPCQIAGLNHFLRKNYDNLVTCEIFCHSVPSPKVWQLYLREQLSNLNWKYSDISHIGFRDKKTGWRDYHIAIMNKNGSLFDTPASINPYMRGFLAGLYDRPSCHACPAKKLKSGSDLTIGDFWGIQNVLPEIDDNKGTSAVLVNTTKGRNFLNLISACIHECHYDLVIKYNPALEKCCRENSKRNLFFLSDNITFLKKIKLLTKETLFFRLKKKLRYCIRILFNLYRK